MWIEANAPVTVSVYYQEVTKLMPTHIVHKRGRKGSKMHLARRALKELTPRLTIDGETIVSITPKKESRWIEYCREQMREFGYVNLPDTGKERNLFRGWRLRNCIEKDGKLVYLEPEN